MQKYYIFSLVIRKIEPEMKSLGPMMMFKKLKDLSILPIYVLTYYSYTHRSDLPSLLAKQGALIRIWKIVFEIFQMMRESVNPVKFWV